MMGKKMRGAALVGLICVTGCKTSTPERALHWPWQLPDAPPEELVAPPVSDGRFSSPPSYPRSVMGPKPINRSNNQLAPPTTLRSPQTF